MRITVCAAFYPPYRGGYAESVRLLAEGFAARGHAVTVIACDTGGAPRKEAVYGVSIRRVPAWNPSFLHGSFPLPNPFSFWNALRGARREGVDIISTQTRFFPSTFIGFIFAKLHGIPVVHTERGASHTHSDSLVIRAFAKIADHTAGRLVCRFSNGVVGVSDAASAFARHLGARGPVTVHNGIDADSWRRPEEYVRTDAALRIAFVGRLVRAKGVDDLLAASALLLAEFPTLRVSIIGDGPYRRAFERGACELSISHAVVFCGDSDQEGIRNVLWQSDIFVNPSRSEGFPRSVLEAAAAGLPVVATDVGGTREIIEDGISGILVPPQSPDALAHAIRALAQSAGARLRMGGKAVARSRDFSLEKMVEGHARISALCAESRA